MNPLPPPDSFRLSAAIGWLELGNPQEARAELDALAPERQGLPAVLEVRWQVEAAVKAWDRCLDIAQALMDQEPQRPAAWLLRAYALRRVPGGGLKTAWEALRPAVAQFPKEPTIPYNLACYACQMGDLAGAWGWLEQALAVGDAKRIRSMALEDPDLEPLRPRLRSDS